jgi:GT2 family glycosyltransferase
MNKKVAIIIANWNGLRFLGDCLSSVYSQTYQNFEVYLIDNGSTDKSVPFVKQNFPRTHIIELEKNTGFSYANNIGIHTAFKDSEVRYILTLNNDTKIDLNCVLYLVRTIEQDKNIASVTSKIKYADTDIIDSVGILISRDGGAMSRGYKEIDHGQYDKVEEVFGVSACSALYRREALEDVQEKREFFDNSFFAYYEDLDLAWRLRLRGWKSWYCPEAVVSHIHSGTSISYSPFKAYHVNRNRFFVILKDLPLKYSINAFCMTPYRYVKLLRSMLFVKSGPSYELKKKTNSIIPILITIKGWASFFLYTPFLILKRYTIQSRTTVTQKEINTWFDRYQGSIHDMIYK